MNLIKLVKWSLFVIYLLLTSYIVFFARRRHGIVWSDEYLNLIPIRRNIEAYLSPDMNRQDFYSNLVGNIFLFIPLPIFVLELFDVSIKQVLLVGFVTSLLIECIQYINHIGVADIDDVILNTIGAIIGIFLWRILHQIYTHLGN